MKRIAEADLLAIEELVRGRTDGSTAKQIAAGLDPSPPRRTLQYRLKSLVDSQRLAVQGSGRWTRYRMPTAVPLLAELRTGRATVSGRVLAMEPLSKAGAAVRNQVELPLEVREPVGYHRDFLDSYLPNRTFYLSEVERTELRKIGSAAPAEQPAGSFAKQILNRLLIDLSWNSSRLEGNTYSLLDAERLIEAGEEAEGKDTRETQMILNHKDAIAFLVDGAEEIGFNRHTILSLHAWLADNLLPDPAAPGRLRFRGVGIGGSVFRPLEVPQLIEECFDLALAKVSVIEDPFEQAFFAMVQFPYLQPFDDVNKRVSRLAANIPFIRANLSPLSFEEVPRDHYSKALLGVYELRRTELLRDLFVRAYRQSAARYAAVRQSIGEPDALRMRYRNALREVVAAVVHAAMDKKQAAAHVASWAGEHIAEPDRERFRSIAERELLSLHQGNFARYRVTPSEFATWHGVWNR
ncbi:MAG: Fic family protein [Acidobacteriia bacterium]|nr:Fic family protein [Terriglobia bacterium]